MTTTPAGDKPAAPDERQYEVDERWIEAMVKMTADQCFVALRIMHWAADHNLLDCGIRDIAQRTGVNRKTVDRCMRALQVAGLARVKKAAGESSRFLITGVKRVWKFHPRPFTITDWDPEIDSDERGHLPDSAGPPSVYQGARKFDGIPHPADHAGPPPGLGGATPRGGGPGLTGLAENRMRSGGVADRSRPLLTPDPERRSPAERSTPDRAVLPRAGAPKDAVEQRPTTGPLESGSADTACGAPARDETGKGAGKRGRGGATMGLPGLAAAAKAKRERGVKTKLPDGWAPNAKHCILARELSIDVDWEAQHFREWVLARGERYVDWDMAFSNRLRNAVRFNRGAPGRQSSPQPGVVDQVAPSALRPEAKIRTGELLAPMPLPEPSRGPRS